MAQKAKKQSWKTPNTGLPFPNFALGKTEIPAVCKCIYDGTNFYVTNHLDMHTLHHNGAFGTSSLTFRGLSYDDLSFTRRAYFLKKMKTLSSCDLPLNLNGSSKPSSCPSLNCLKASKGKRVRIDVESSKTGGPELLVHVSSESISTNVTGPNSPKSPFSISSDEKSRLPQKNEMSHEDLENVEMDDCVGVDKSRKTNGPTTFDIDTHLLEEEKLILMPEEAIFLSFGVGCLAIYNAQGQTLDYRQCWRDLVTLDSDFPTQYAAYHYFRGKNWIPKNGSLYGASYVLYEGGPDTRHSTYIVYLLESRKPKPTWMELAAWQRLATHISKQVLLCEVSVPDAFRPEISEPRSVFDMDLREMSLFRWQPLLELDRS